MPEQVVSIPVISFLGKWALEIIGALVAVVFYLTHRRIDKNASDLAEHKEETKGEFMAVSTTHRELFRLIRDMDGTRQTSCVSRTEFDTAMTQMANAVVKIERLTELLIRHLGEADKGKKDETF